MGILRLLYDAKYTFGLRNNDFDFPEVRDFIEQINAASKSLCEQHNNLNLLSKKVGNFNISYIQTPHGNEIIPHPLWDLIYLMSRVLVSLFLKSTKLNFY